MVFEEGKSKRREAELLEVPEATLRKRLKRDDVATSLGRYRATFTPEVEENLIEHIKKLDEMFYGMTLKKMRSTVYEYAERNNYTHHFNRETKMAGKHWVRDFMKRHADRISLRQPTSTSIARAMGFNRPQVNRFYDQLQTLQEKYKLEPCQIYNMDESGFTTVPNKAPKVLSSKGKRCVNKISSAERGTNVTVVCAMSALGNYVPPAFIFPRKRMKVELLDGAPANSIGLVTESGRMNTDLFLDWLNHFKYHVKPTDAYPVLLILDNYLAHTSLAAVKFCRQNNIHLLTIPPHSTHKMQPLDRCFFSPLKNIMPMSVKSGC
ncbi:hypothetical protein HF086_005910 [Spodoptera exigua]|uniref:HTH CENPB-type domain-containing protein n=1 Tax=Spodoptera exigua TaxID=7107 RepID=A0A922S8I4_SPOEX|nr:hypothetical protein HF086_005910 [Spodoptera exigua]